MNLGYVISSTIAGVILLSLLSLNMKIVRNSGELTLSGMANTHSLSVSEYLEHDLRSIGYGVQGIHPVLDATEHSIRFLIQLDGHIEPKEIAWEFEFDAPAAQKNDAIKPLNRYQDGEVWQASSAVTTFELEYYNHKREKLDAQSLDPADISLIRWTIVTQTRERFLGGRFGTSVWTGEVTPHNLALMP